MNISINTHCLLGDMPVSKQFELLNEYGYHVFETWAIPQANVEPLRAQMDKYSITLSAMCTDASVLNDVCGHAEYEAGVISALAKAQRLDCHKLITQVGQATLASRSEQHAAIVAGIRRVLPLLEEAGTMLLVEPLNDVKDHKGYYLTSSVEGLEIVREVDSPYVKLLFDVYHQVHMGEDVVSIIGGNIGDIGHFHVAGHPRRDAELFGEFNYRAVFEVIERLGFRGYVGLELMPGSIERARLLLSDLRIYATNC